MNNQPEILIVDDEQIVVTRLKSSLEKDGYAVEIFTESEKALQRISQKFFDVVITDLKMPNVDGMEIFRHVRELWPHAKIIMISGFATIETAKEAMKNGVYDFIVKPFKICQIKEIIARSLEKST
jgi:DNA-binding NtrC family response regulator